MNLILVGKVWFKEGQLPSSLATKYESWKLKKNDSQEESVEEDYNAQKRRLLKSCKSPLQKKKNCNKNQEKCNFFFTNKNDDIDSYSNGDQTDTVKVMIRNIFWILQIR